MRKGGPPWDAVTAGPDAMGLCRTDPGLAYSPGFLLLELPEGANAAVAINKALLAENI